MKNQDKNFHTSSKDISVSGSKVSFHIERRSRFLTMESTGVGVYSVLYVIFIIMFFTMYFQVAFGVGRGFTFTGLLGVFERAPSIDISWMVRLTNVNLGDWGIFNFLRDFVNFNLQIISVLLYIAVGIAQLVVYVGYILGLLTGVV